MNNDAPTLANVKEYFQKNAKGKLWIPTKTRNEIIADEGFSAKPKYAVEGRVYRWRFTSIGGGMWEVSLGPLQY